MKNTRKILSLLVVLAMALCMTIPAYAETVGTITIENAQTGETYTAYKIFDVVYDSADHYAYTIDKSSKWFNKVEAYATDADNGLTLTQVNGGTLYTVTIDETKFNAAGFAEKLKEANITEGGIAFVNNEAAVSSLGYYFVTTANGTLCNLTTTKPNATIYDKNEKPAIEKKADDADGIVEVGQIINYDIKGTVPSTTGYTTYTYKVTDTMGAGLTFNKDVKVTIGGTEVAATVDYAAANGFAVTLDMVNYTAGDAIVITYSATVDADAVADNVAADALSNKATLEYSNNPNSTTTAAATDAIVDLDTCEIVIDKFDGDTQGKLANAEFVLYKLDGQTKEYYSWNNGKVEWTTEDKATVVVTDSNGAAKFQGLGDGAYKLEETKAPAGYNRLEAAKDVVIAAPEEGKTLVTSIEVDVENQAGTLLPSTGGIGTTIFYVVGTVLIAAAFILIVTKKRMSTEK